MKTKNIFYSQQFVTKARGGQKSPNPALEKVISRRQRFLNLFIQIYCLLFLIFIYCLSDYPFSDSLRLCPLRIHLNPNPDVIRNIFKELFVQLSLYRFRRTKLVRTQTNLKTVIVCFKYLTLYIKL